MSEPAIQHYRIHFKLGFDLADETHANQLIFFFFEKRLKASLQSPRGEVTFIITNFSEFLRNICHIYRIP